MVRTMVEKLLHRKRGSVTYDMVYMVLLAWVVSSKQENLYVLLQYYIKFKTSDDKRYTLRVQHS